MDKILKSSDSEAIVQFRYLYIGDNSIFFKHTINVQLYYVKRKTFPILLHAGHIRTGLNSKFPSRNMLPISNITVLLLEK
jgi:hypothetical protein